MHFLLSFIKDAGGGEKVRPNPKAAVAEPARKNLFSPCQIPDKENQGGNSTIWSMFLLANKDPGCLMFLWACVQMI